MEMVLEAEGLSKSFHHPVSLTLFSDVHLKVAKGESVAIMGASGEGKSTLLHILGTLEDPCGGRLTLSGQPVNASTRDTLRNQKIGFVFQSFHLLEDYTVLENVLMPARIARNSTAKGSASYKRALTLLDLLGLSPRAHFHTKMLSGGEKQRCAIARALCNNPDLLLTDEPTGNLDHHNSEIIHNALLSLSEKEGKALVVVTHDPDLARLCDRTLVLRDQKLWEHAP